MYEAALAWAKKQKNFTIFELMGATGGTYTEADLIGLRLECERVCTHMDNNGVRHLKIKSNI